MPVRSIRDGTLTIKSTDASPKTLVVSFVDGGLSWTERRPAVIHSDRGTLDHARIGTEAPLTGSFSFRYQDTDLRSALIDLSFAAGAGGPSRPQTVYAGWLDPTTDATVLVGATLFGRTIQVGDVIGGSSTSSGAATEGGGPNLLFEINDPAGGTDESILFMAARVTEYQFSEGEEFNQVTATFESAVKQPHIW